MKCAVFTTDRDMPELEELLLTLEMDVERVFFQDRQASPRTFFGRGKIEEIKDWLDSHEDIEAIVVNHELRPAQLYFLEKTFGKRVFDRVGIILEIFMKNAHSREAKLQVELAEMKYQLSFIREYVHSAKEGEHPGFMAGGEYAVDDYYLFIKRRITRIKSELDSIRRDREAKRRARRRKGFYLVAIAGYTNAGKSTLLNTLTGERILVEDRMFSTLSTTTRRIESPYRILVTDTVGFIKELPPWIIEAFKATLEEVFQADAIILVLDASEDDFTMKTKLKASEEVLFPDIGGIPVILALNKCDSMDENECDRKKRMMEGGRYEVVPISARTGKGTDALVKLLESIFSPEISMSVWLPAGEESTVSWAYDHGMVRDIDRKEGIKLEVEIYERSAAVLEKKVKEAGGKVIRVERHDAPEQNL